MGCGPLLGTFVPQYFVCLQSSKVDSRNEEGLLDKERLMLQLEAGQVCTAGIRVRRCSQCTVSIASMLLKRKEIYSGNRRAEDIHTDSHIYTYGNT